MIKSNLYSLLHLVLFSNYTLLEWHLVAGELGQMYGLGRAQRDMHPRPLTHFFESVYEIHSPRVLRTL